MLAVAAMLRLMSDPKPPVAILVNKQVRAFHVCALNAERSIP